MPRPRWFPPRGAKPFGGYYTIRSFCVSGCRLARSKRQWRRRPPGDGAPRHSHSSRCPLATLWLTGNGYSGTELRRVAQVLSPQARLRRRASKTRVTARRARSSFARSAHKLVAQDGVLPLYRSTELRPIPPVQASTKSLHGDGLAWLVTAFLIGSPLLGRCSLRAAPHSARTGVPAAEFRPLTSGQRPSSLASARLGLDVTPIG